MAQIRHYFDALNLGRMLEKHNYYDKGNKEEFIERVCSNKDIQIADLEQYAREIKENSSNKENPIGYLMLNLTSKKEEDQKAQTEGIIVEGYIGTWSVIDTYDNYRLLEHEEYGDETCLLLVDENNKFIAETFDDIETALRDEELL